MVLRKPNLLDAFQASAPEGKKAPPGKQPASAAGPFAQERAAPSAAPKLPMNRRSLWSQMASDRLVQFALVVCVAGVGIAYYVGRSGTGSGTARAAEGSEQGGTALRENPAGAARSPDPAEANIKAAALSQFSNDQKFLDPANKFTVRVALHSNDEAGRKAALADRDYLRTEGYPVVQPYLVENNFVVCVGFAPTVAELGRLLDQVSKLAGPKGGRKLPYQSAYIDNISKVAARKK
jgi:hypothetical protein